MVSGISQTAPLRRTVLTVMALNLGYFGVEFFAALRLGSVSLFADSIDFLEDAAINFLIFAALGWAALARARVGMCLAALMMVPAAAFLWMVVQKFLAPSLPRRCRCRRWGWARLRST